ncbi:MAG TPA: ABC transporter permease [Bacteroidia bacterium]|nr:ABC transporter permease [Bacteroidia bacterium]
MFTNYFKIALRNIWRNKTFSAINLVGLSVSMSLGMLIILIVKEQYTFDNFHHDSDRVYRVNTRAIKVKGYMEDYASAPLPLGNALNDNYSFTENIVRVNRYFNGEASHGNVTVPMNGLVVDPSFLEVFNFPLQKGNPAAALGKPNDLVLTQKAAGKIFGKTDPIGKALSISGYGNFIVTGVLQEFAGKTHFEFEMLGSITALPGIEKDKDKKNVYETSLNNWNNYFTNYIYVKLKEGQHTAEVEQALAEISRKYYDGLKLSDPGDKGFEFYLQPLSKITPGPDLIGRMGSGLPGFVLIFLGALAGVILLMSVFNFTNLMIAKSLSRAREIGVRKVMGAQRFQVFFQFVGETVLFSLIALMFSYVLLQFLKSGYSQLPLSAHFSLDMKEDFFVYIIFIAFAVFVGVIAGLLPAGYLSAFRPASVLKDAGNLKIYSRLNLRKILMTAQFTLSIIFVIVVLVIYSQIDFMLKADYGFDQKNKLNINLQGAAFEKIANQVRNLPGVGQVGGVSYPLGTYNSRTSNYKRNPNDESFAMKDIIVEKNYVDNINLTFLAGKNFDANERGGEKYILLNEKALSHFGFANPAAAIGQTIYMNDSIALSVKGVVKDFHARPLDSPIEPLGLRCNISQLSYLSAKINPAQKEAVIASMKAIWKKFVPNNRLDYSMMEEEIDDAYRESGMQDFLMILGYITFLAVTLACLGMLGMAMYATQIRIKEVGVRKVMGASVSDIVILLSKSFMMLIGIGIIIGTPISFLVGNLFLDSFASRIEITPMLLAAGIAIIAGLGLLTICSQTIKAAISNPVRSLRTE